MMTSQYESEPNSQGAPAQFSEQSMLMNSEAAYDRLTSYAFAKRYIGGKTVADIGWEDIGYGSRLLAKTARSVAGLTNSSELVERASAVYPAPNLRYQKADLPTLPHPEDSFEVVVALSVIENLEHPEDLLREVRRVLKRDGVLIISTPDKQTYSNSHGGVDGRRNIYVPEFRELLEHFFKHVHVYRQGAVAGGLVFPAFEQPTSTPVESARFSLPDPDLGSVLPATRSVVAVCGDADASEQEGQPYLLLDRDRRVFDECAEWAEDVELMRGEIQQMQETEVQAFVDAFKVQQSLARNLALALRRYPMHAVNIIYGNIYAVRRKGARGMVRGAFRRLSNLRSVNVIRGNVHAIRNKGAKGASRRLFHPYQRPQAKDEER
jgi:2-polyprenyl-3-methyl-5-hydroxy-6-metoxy-1,4-benzoquinol methylase